MTPHPSNPTPGGSSGGSSGASPPSSSASPSSPSSTPFHSRSTTNRRNNKNDKNTNNNNTYYQPSVHQFSCRGAFHLQPKKNDGDDTDSNSDSKGSKNDSNKGAASQQQQSSAKEGADLEALIKDTFLCNGIQTKLRHVSDYPLAKSKEEAIRWFEGSSSPMVGRGAGGTEVYASPPNNENTVDGNPDSNDEEEGVESTEMEPESSFTSYGTTQVNILVVQEVPVIAQDEAAAARHPRSSSMGNNPFGGFGAIANPSGMLNPFGSLFGGFSGSGGMADLSSQQNPGEEGSNNSNNNSGSWLKGSRSVSSSVTSSTSMDRDENGKRVVTTVTKKTMVNGEGKRKTMTLTVERHVDDGGRVVTKKEVQIDGKDVDQIEVGTNPSGNDAIRSVLDGGTNNGSDKMANRPPHPMLSPFHHPLVVAASEPTSPAEVAVIATDCLFGVSVSDSSSTDPESTVVPQKTKTNNNSDNSVGWRKSEYLFRLGRFLPPFMIVNKYYQDKEAEEQRRKEMKKEYNDMRESHKKNRWDQLNGRSNDTEDAKIDKKEKEESKHPESPISNNLSNVSTSTEYYLQRIYVQMGKNADMMGVLLKGMIQPDFPKKVQINGQKILDNMGPTAERTGKLMGDVWE
eukprot:CAMPEP_0201995378 /NCGR_PEP_ID=MMETSP0905-20130828/2844_1 /ASSEMBLY_ACC=CAM_ASM_000554 /TAXON_ID=420261 /ORGANISM="Thalassiosira antarctica, Strain CCMP982" /LENGTH=626 /DNA_ID=CAMNT_0048550469 /DNA_START=34 /DNA_END=1911 /DNA_ORIENTATION=-